MRGSFCLCFCVVCCLVCTLCLEDRVVCGGWLGACWLCSDWVGVMFGDCVCVGGELSMRWLNW